MNPKRLLAVVLAFATVLTCAAFPALAADAVPVTLTYHSKSGTTSFENYSFSNAVDGDDTTHWTSDQYNSSNSDLKLHSVVFELSEPGTLDELTIKWGGSSWGQMGVDAYNVYVSEDNENYAQILSYQGLYDTDTAEETYAGYEYVSGTIDSVFGDLKYNVTETGLDARNVRYVKIEITKHLYRSSILEITAATKEGGALVSASYTVKYQYEDGRQAAPDKIVNTGFVGDTVTETAITVDGFYPDRQSKSVRLIDGVNTIIFVYAPNAQGDPVEVYPVNATTDMVEAKSVTYAIDGVAFSAGAPNYNYFKSGPISTTGDGTTPIGSVVFEFSAPTNLTEIWLNMGSCNVSSAKLYGSNTTDVPSASDWTELYTFDSIEYDVVDETNADLGRLNVSTLSHSGYYRYFKFVVTGISKTGSIVWLETGFTGTQKSDVPEKVAVNYVVEYVNVHGLPVSRPRFETSYVGEEITETAIQIDGYTVDQSSKTITLGADETANVISFVYTVTDPDVPVAILPISVTTNMTPLQNRDNPVEGIIDGVAYASAHAYFKSENLSMGNGQTVLGSFVFDFGKEYNLTEIWFNMGACNMKHGKLYGSNSTSDPDSAAWTELTAFEDLVYTAVDASNSSKGKTNTQTISHNGGYRYFKIEVTGLSQTGGLTWLEASFKGIDAPKATPVVCTVNYVDENGNPIADSKSVEAFVGDTVVESAIEIYGFAADKDSESIVLDADTTKNVITFTYSAIDPNEPVQLSPVNVITDMGQEKSIYYAFDGVAFSAGSPDYNYFKSGGLPKGNGELVLGKIVLEFEHPTNLAEIWFNVGECHMTYGKLYGSNVTKSLSGPGWTEIHSFEDLEFVDVDALDADKGKTNTQTIEHEGYYRYFKIEILNVSTDASLIWLETTLKGTKNPSLPEEPLKVAVDYVVKYVDADGLPVFNTKNAKDFIGDEVTENAVEIDGYTVDKASQTITLDADVSNNIITFTYTAIDPDAPVTIVPISVTTDMTVNSMYTPITAIKDGVAYAFSGHYFKSQSLPMGYGQTVLGNVVFDFGRKFNLTEIEFNMGACNMMYGKLYGSNTTSNPDSTAWTELTSFDDLTYTVVDENDANKGRTNTQTIEHSGGYRYFKIEVTGLSKAGGLTWLEASFKGTKRIDSVDILGANIRLQDNGLSAGIRFAAKVNKLKENITGEYRYSEDAAVKFGMYLLPEDMLEGKTLVAYLEDGGADVLDIPAKKIFSQDDSSLTFTAVLTDIPEDAYARDIVAVPYILKDGEYTYFDEMTRNYASVASVARRTTYSDSAIAAVEDADLKAKMQAIADELDVIIEALQGSDDSAEDVPFTPIVSQQDYFETKTYTASSNETAVQYLFHEPIRATGKDYPLIIFLHGLGDTVNINSLGTSTPLVNSLILLENESEKYSAYTLVPSTPLSNEGWWTSQQLTAFKALIAELVEDYSIDPARIYISGISMGGMVTCQLLNEMSPNTFAAAVPMSGTYNLTDPDSMHNTAFRIYHVATDSTVNVSCARSLNNQLTLSGHPNFEYFEFETGTHTSPLNTVFTDGRDEFFDWLFAQSLPADVTPTFAK